jgi:hypothetical protein
MANRLPAALAALSLALLLAACGQTGPAAEFGQSTAAFSPPAASGSPPAALPPGDMATDPSRLRGLAAADVRAVLGNPSYLRREAPAEIWQYYGSGCVLDLFFYDDGTAQRVLHAELRSRTLGQSDTATCLRQLLIGQRGAPSG